MAREALVSKRDAAMRSTRLARRKLGRIRREAGIVDLGRYDPQLRTDDQINRMTEKQLDAYLRRTGKGEGGFRSRKTQFVKLGQGVTTRKKWRETDKLMRERKAKAEAIFKPFQDVYIKSLNQTVGERRDLVNPPKQRQLESGGLIPELRSPRQVRDEAALDVLARQARKDTSKIGLKQYRQRAMRALNQMDTTFMAYGNASIAARVKNLSDSQFAVLWQIRDFMNNVASFYEAAKQMDDEAMSADKSEMFEMSMSQDYAEILGLLDSVESAKI